LIEKKAAKDAFIASNGESAYTNKVVEEGTQYPTEPIDILNETLSGVYAVTAVGVDKNGGKGKQTEFVFNGIEWEYIGDAQFYQPASFVASLSIDDPSVKWYKSVGLDTVLYKLENYYASIDEPGYSLKLNWDEDGALTFRTGAVNPSNAAYWRLPTPFVNASYGAYSAEVDTDPEYTYYDDETKVITINYRRIVSAGSFANWYDMTITLP
jgi:hypothetical protein